MVSQFAAQRGFHIVAMHMLANADIPCRHPDRGTIAADGAACSYVMDRKFVARCNRVDKGDLAVSQDDHLPWHERRQRNGYIIVRGDLQRHDFWVGHGLCLNRCQR